MMNRWAPCLLLGCLGAPSCERRAPSHSEASPRVAVDATSPTVPEQIEASPAPPAPEEEAAEEGERCVGPVVDHLDIVSDHEVFAKAVAAYVAAIWSAQAKGTTPPSEVDRDAMAADIAEAQKAVADLQTRGEAYVKDSSLETLVLHSAFGWDAGKGSRRPPWSPVALPELAGSWDAQLTALAALREQFAVTFGERARIRGQVSPYYLPRIMTGAVDDNTRFRIEWVWEAAFGKGSHAQTWRPLTDEENELAVAPRLRVDEGRMVYFDAEPPAQVWKDSGYGLDKGYEGFKSLEVRVVKECGHGPTIARVPLRDSVALRIQMQHFAPDTSEKAFSIPPDDEETE